MKKRTPEEILSYAREVKTAFYPEFEAMLQNKPPGYVLVELQRDDNLSLGDIYLKIDPGAPGLDDVAMFSYRIPHSGRYYQKERVIARMIAAYYGDARDARIEKELSNNSALDVLIADRQT